MVRGLRIFAHDFGVAGKGFDKGERSPSFHVQDVLVLVSVMTATA